MRPTLGSANSISQGMVAANSSLQSELSSFCLLYFFFLHHKPLRSSNYERLYTTITIALNFVLTSVKEITLGIYEQ